MDELLKWPLGWMVTAWTEAGQGLVAVDGGNFEGIWLLLA